MALSVEKINADTSFIFTFTPAFVPEKDKARFPGALTVLVDPWLVGHCSMWHPAFQLSNHTSECSYSSLAELPHPPDMIVISQDKPDHCHRATLCSMPKHWPTIIVAPSSAARRILSWKYFNPEQVHVLDAYHKDRHGSIHSRPIPAYTSSSSAGELTLAYLPSKHDVTGLHTAIGITYRPPGALLATSNGGVIHLSELMNPTASSFRMRDVKSSTTLNANFNARGCHLSPLQKNTAELHRPDSANPELDPDQWMLSSQTTGLFAEDARHHQEATMSVIYTPHGVAPAAVKPYVTSHLVPNRAYPPTALFHSINMEINPWFMGGVVVAGAPNGCELAKMLRVKHWFSAHDEVKESSGVAVTWVKSSRYDVDAVIKMLGPDGTRETIQIHAPQVGETTRILC